MENTFPIVWGDVSVIEADLVCINSLLEQNKGKIIYNGTSNVPIKLVSDW